MNESTAVVIGATDLIGNSLVKQLLNDSSFSKITILVRNWDDFRHPKMEVVPVNYNNLDELRMKLPMGNTNSIGYNLFLFINLQKFNL